MGIFEGEHSQQKELDNCVRTPNSIISNGMTLEQTVCESQDRSAKTTTSINLSLCISSRFPDTILLNETQQTTTRSDVTHRGVGSGEYLPEEIWIKDFTYRNACVRFFISDIGVLRNGLGDPYGDSLSDSATIALANAKSSSFILSLQMEFNYFPMFD